MFEAIKNLIKNFRSSLANAEKEYNESVVYINEYVGSKDRAIEMQKAFDKRNLVEEGWVDVYNQISKEIVVVKEKIANFCFAPIPEDLSKTLEDFLNIDQHSEFEIDVMVNKCKTNYFASKRLFESLGKKVSDRHDFIDVESVLEPVEMMDAMIKKAFSSRNPNAYGFVSLTYDSTWEKLEKSVGDFINKGCAN